MSEYHVGLPNKMMLTVEIEDTPITMHITFPQGQRVTFHYKGNPERTATVSIRKRTFDLDRLCRR